MCRQARSWVEVFFDEKYKYIAIFRILELANIFSWTTECNIMVLYSEMLGHDGFIAKLWVHK